MNPPEGASSLVKIGKFKASFIIVRESWSILKKDKEIIWFPILSFITNLIILSIFIYILYFSDLRNYKLFNDNYSNGKYIIKYAIDFIYYLSLFLVTNYFLTGIYIITEGRLNGQNLSFSDGIKGANTNFGKIFVWSLISSTVGLILQIISDRSKAIGKIVSSLFGAAWSVMTYFSLPSLVIGKKSAIESFKESAKIINNRWGEVVIIQFGIGLYFVIPIFIGLGISALIIMSFPIIKVIIPVVIILVVYFILLMIISSSLNAIFKVVLYEYSKTGKIAEGFTEEILKGTIETKKV